MAESNMTLKNSSDSKDDVEISTPILFKSNMPAWVPAVSVATAMLIFLTASFYIRHRKVVKKRQILMDYFYIILQYGGLRRKRMVTALCNTNAITLRQLGRSFMISFDNNENSCPFFLEDTAFTRNNVTPLPSTKSASKTRNRLRAPFKRVMSQFEDSGGSVHDILMKFKSKRKGGNQSQMNRQHLVPPRRNSLSSIHEDESPFLARSEFESTPQFHQRRNAYVFGSYDNQFTSMAELLSESEDQSLSNLMLEHCRSRRPSSINRKSFPHSTSDVDDEEFHVINSNSNNLRVFQLGTNSSRRQSSSHFSQHSQRSCNRQYSNKEPLILVHSASNDISSSQESDEVIDPYSSGVVFVRRVSTSRGDHYQPESPPPSYSQRKRASLSTVSYVQSSNINDYYQHCLKSPKLPGDLKSDEDEFTFDEDKRSSKPKSSWSWRKSTSKKDSPQATTGPSRSKRSRLSLGEIGISNFNRRFEESMGSMQEQDIEGSFLKLSRDLSESGSRKPSGAWRRLKNVFAGIRWSQTSGPKPKQVKSSLSEERSKTKNKRSNNNRKWNRFFNALTGFRSLPEDKNYGCQVRGPQSSKSLPMGLDKHSITIDDLEFHMAMPMDSQPARHKKRIFKHSLSKGDMFADKSFRRAPPKTRSFPDNIVLFQGDTPKSPCLYHLQSDPSGTATYQKYSGRKYKRHLDANEDHAQCRSNVDFLQSPLHTGYFPSSFDSSSRTYLHQSGSISPGATSPLARKRDRRYRSLSPLPERKYGSSPRKEKNVRWYSHSERNSLSERGNLMSPYPRPGSCSAFTFSPEILAKGNSLSNIASSNDCLQVSDEDLGGTTPLLNAKDIDHTTSEETTDPGTRFDFITIDMEPPVTDDQQVATTCESDISEYHEQNKDECSIESDSCAKDVDESTSDTGTESQSKSCTQTNDKTSSSLDSIYFDAFSVPGSPITSVRSLNFLIASDLYPSCQCNTPASMSFPLIDPPSLNTSLPPPTVHSELQSVGTEQRTNASERDVDTIPSVNVFSSPNLTTQAVDHNVLPPPPPPPYSLTADECVVESSGDDLIQPEEDSVSIKDDVNVTPSPSTTLDSETSKSLTITSSTDAQTNNGGDVIGVYTLPLSCMKTPSLEHQDSMTSDEESLVNLTRLPRFGRRASQCATPSPDTTLEGKKNDSKQMEMHRREVIPESDAEPSSSKHFIYDTVV